MFFQIEGNSSTKVSIRDATIVSCSAGQVRAACGAGVHMPRVFEPVVIWRMLVTCRGASRLD